MTEKLYVLGHPVAHSKSPSLHNAVYSALGLDWEYGLADCPTRADARAFLARADWLACNVTMPFKPLALEVASWGSEAARGAQGANVLARRDGRLLADNTDGKGCVAYLRRCGVNFAGARTVVCGTGPTSLSIVHAVAQTGASDVTLLGRDAARARGVLDAYRDRLRDTGAASARGASCATELRANAYADATPDVESADIVIDATPLGMKPGDPAPFDVGLLSAGQVVLDVVYGHGESVLIAAARAAGCVAFDGSGMLVAQAVETVRDLVEWLDVPIDLRDCDLFAIMYDQL